MTRVCTPSRLHFGLFALPTDDDPTWPARRYGGVGLMLEQPGVTVRVEPAACWSATGPLAARALAFAQAVCAQLHIAQPMQVTVEAAPPEHVGLGTGTQLGLAVARAVTHQLDVDGQERSAFDLARLTGRGERSALGLHGFAHGGLLVDGGKRSADALAPLVARMAFPQAWSILLVQPRELHGVHGMRERAAFRSLAGQTHDAQRTDALCRLVLLGLLPALAEGDFDAFGAAVYEFNRRVGEMFEPWQGGVYAHPRIAELVAALRSSGLVRGVGQSSWGPTVFAFVRAEQVPELCTWLARQRGDANEERLVTAAANRGAYIA